MATISEIAKRLNDYVSNLDTNINEAVNNVEQQLVDLNRGQMLISRGNDDKALINERTGDEKLSKQYARRQNKTYPDLFVRGNYQEEMRLISRHKENYYSVISYHNLYKYISIQYKNAHGIAPSNRIKAYAITGKAIAKHLQNKVFK